MGITFEKYLAERKTKLRKLENEVLLLSSVHFPVKIHVFGYEEFELFSEDYSLATAFKIKKRDKDSNVGHSTTIDGGCSSEIHQTYPQFYTQLKTEGLILPIYIQHKGFETDNRVVINEEHVTSGWGNWRENNSRNYADIDLKKAFDFFRKRGVKEDLLISLKKRISSLKH